MFVSFDSNTMYSDGKTAAHAVQVLRNVSSEALKPVNSTPFFVAVGFHRPHLPWVVPKAFFDLYDDANITLADHDKRPVNYNVTGVYHMEVVRSSTTTTTTTTTKEWRVCVCSVVKRCRALNALVSQLVCVTIATTYSLNKLEMQPHRRRAAILLGPAEWTEALSAPRQQGRYVVVGGTVRLGGHLYTS